MRIIVNYLGSNVLKGILLVTVLLLSIDLFVYFINELRLVGVGNYNFLTACGFVALTIPRKLYIIAPWAVLIGTLMVLGAMAKNHELLFIRAIGLSPNKIALYCSGYILMFTTLIFILGELLAPKIELFAQKQKTLALSQGNAIYTSLGTWIRNKNKFIHVASIKKQNMLQEVTIYELDDHFNIIKSIFAETAKLIAENDCKANNKKCNTVWELNQVTVTDLTNLMPDQFGDPSIAQEFISKLKLYKLDKLEVQNLLDLNILGAANIKHLERLSIIHLSKIIKDRIANNLTVIDYKIAYWKKIVQPFSIIIMGYLAIPFVLKPLRSYSKGGYLLTGVALGIGFYFLNAFLNPLVTVLNFPPVLAVMLPSLIFLSIAIYLSAKT